MAEVLFSFDAKGNAAPYDTAEPDLVLSLAWPEPEEGGEIIDFEGDA